MREKKARQSKEELQGKLLGLRVTTYGNDVFGSSKRDSKVSRVGTWHRIGLPLRKKSLEGGTKLLACLSVPLPPLSSCR